MGDLNFLVLRVVVTHGHDVTNLLSILASSFSERTRGNCCFPVFVHTIPWYPAKQKIYMVSVKVSWAVEAGDKVCDKH